MAASERNGSRLASRYTSIKTRIETRRIDIMRNSSSPASRYTSIKTRIETTTGSRAGQPRGPPLATLPSKQGLKRPAFHLACQKVLPLATLPSKQGLKPSLSCPTPLKCPPLATLPSKQGLKPDRAQAFYPTGTGLSLHFHQNKD